MATTSGSIKDTGGIERQSTVKFVPGRMSFKEYDKKMKAFRPQNKYWIPVLTKKEYWDEKDPDTQMPLFTVDEKELIRAADRNAVSTYIMGNSGETDTYTNGATAFDIRESLRQRYENKDPLGLSELTELYLTSVTRHIDECPDIWFSDIKYYMNLIVEAGGTKRTDKEIIAHIVTSATRKYDIPKTIINSWPVTSTTGTRMVDVQNELRNYWRRNFMQSDLPVVPRNYSNRNSEAYVSTTTRGTGKENYKDGTGKRTTNFTNTNGNGNQKPWKKFKGTCNKCGAIGHKGKSCPKESANGDTQPGQRKCYNCGKPGHLANSCRETKNFRQNSGSSGKGTYLGNIDNNQYEESTGYLGENTECSQNTENSGNAVANGRKVKIGDSKYSGRSPNDFNEHSEATKRNINDTFNNRTWELYENEPKQKFVGMVSLNNLTESEDSSMENGKISDSGVAVPEDKATSSGEEDDTEDEDNHGEEAKQEENNDGTSGYFEEDCLIVLKKPRIPFPITYRGMSYHCYHCDGILAYDNTTPKRYNCNKCSYLEDLYTMKEHNAGLYLGWCPDCENIGPALHHCYYCLRNVKKNSTDDKVEILVSALFGANRKLNPARRAELENFIGFLKDNEKELKIWNQNKKDYWENTVLTCSVNFLPCGNHTENTTLSECKNCQGLLQTWKNNNPGVTGKWPNTIYTAARILKEDEPYASDGSKVVIIGIMTTDRNSENKFSRMRDIERHLQGISKDDLKYIAVQNKQNTPEEIAEIWDMEPKHRFRDPSLKNHKNNSLYKFIPIFPKYRIPLSLLHENVQDMLNGNKFGRDMQHEKVKGDPDNLINTIVRELFTTDLDDNTVFMPDRPGYLAVSNYRDLIEGSLTREKYVAYEKRMYMNLNPNVGCLQSEKWNNQRPLAFQCSAVLPSNLSDEGRQGKVQKYEKWLFDTGSNKHATPNEHLLTNFQPFIDFVLTTNGHQEKSTKRGDLKLKSSFERKMISGSCFEKTGGHVVLMNKMGIQVILGKMVLKMVYSPINHLWFLYGTRVPTTTFLNKNLHENTFINQSQNFKVGSTRKINFSNEAIIDHRKLITNNKNNKTKFTDYSNNILDINLAHILCGHLSEEITKRLLQCSKVKWSGKLLPCPDYMLQNAKIKCISEVPYVFEEFLSKAKGLGMKVQYLRLDGAGKHRAEMVKICIQNGIKIEFNSPDTPQMNGLIERILGRIGYITIREKIRGNLSPQALKCMVGYALDHSITAYRLYMFDTPTKRPSKDVTWMDWQPVNPKSHTEGFQNRVQLLEKLATDNTTEGADLELRWDETPFPQVKDPRIYKFITGQGGTNDEYRIQEDNNEPEEPKDGGEILEPQSVQDEEEDALEHIEDVDVGEDELEEEDDVDIQEEIPTSYSQYKRGDRELRGLGLMPKEKVHPMIRNTGYNRLSNNSVTYPAIITDPGEPAIITDPKEPTIKTQAMEGQERKQWHEAIKTEIENFMDREVRKEVSRQDTFRRLNRKLITTKWSFKTKDEVDNSIRYKARCVLRGFMQIPGVDFTEFFPLVACDTAIGVIIEVYLYYNKLYPRDQWVLEMYDVEAAFLNAELLQLSYIEWPQGVQELGFITAKDKELTCVESTKAMYGNIDSPLRWMKTFTKHLVDHLKLVQSRSDPCIFYKIKNNKLILVLALYVDDTLCAGEKREVAWAYQMIEEKFNIKRLGKLKKHLGVNWTWHKDPQCEINLKAIINTMVEDISKKFLTATGKLAKAFDTPVLPNSHLLMNAGEIIKLDIYRSLVGMLMYLTTKVYPELSNSVRELAPHLATPGKDHWKALKRCIGYIADVQDAGQVFRRPGELRSISDCDSNYARDESDRKRISGRINTLGGKITNWTSKKQSTVSLSSTEAKYQALSECVQDAMFTQSLTQELTGECNMAIIYEDNIGAIFLVKIQQVSSRTKHIDVRHHYIRDLHESKRIEVRFKRTDKNSSDILTKNTPKALYEKHASTIRNGTLSCWKEDVKADTLVSTLTPKDESLHESS